MSINVKAKDIDFSNKAHLEQIILEIEGDENVRRKRAAWQAYQALKGNQREYTKRRIIEIYPDTGHTFRLGDINLGKKVNGKLSTAYDIAPMRKLKNDKESEKLSEIYEEYSFNEAFVEADSIYNHFGYVATWLHWLNPNEEVNEDGSYMLRALWPFDYDLVRDEVSGNARIFVLSYADTEVTEQAGGSDGIQQTITESQSDRSAESKIYSFWDKNQFVKVKALGKFSNTDLNITDIKYITEPKASGLERLPISFVSESSSVEYPIEKALHNQTTEFNLAFSDLKTASSSQGHGQLVIEHPDGQQIKKIHMGMHRSINLPQSSKKDAKPTKADYINANPDLTGQLEVLKFEAINILDDEGIKAKGAISGGMEKFASGLDRIVSEADVQKIVESNQNNKYNRLEKNNYLILKDYEDTMSGGTKFKSPSLEVMYPKPKVLISDKEVLENIAKREELGTILPYEKHMLLDPNLTVAQAKKREEEIKKHTQEKIKLQKQMLGEDIEEDEEEPTAPVE